MSSENRTRAEFAFIFIILVGLLYFCTKTDSNINSVEIEKSEIIQIDTTTIDIIDTLIL